MSGRGRLGGVGRLLYLGAAVTVSLIAIYATSPYPGVNAFCCYHNWICQGHTEQRCGDGTQQSGYCGNGDCNIFGCNCDYGCRCDRAKNCLNDSGKKCKKWVPRPHRRKREVHEDTSVRRQIMEEADGDGDGVLSVDEASSYLIAKRIPEALSVRLERSADGMAPEWFAEIDSNGDGFIELGELDGER